MIAVKQLARRIGFWQSAQSQTENEKPNEIAES
jgi:hypothetical protein